MGDGGKEVSNLGAEQGRKVSNLAMGEKGI